jgi:putative ABC transport system permease protein
MTIFGIVWGTVALIILMSFGEGVYRHTKKEFHGLGERIVILWPGSTKKPYKGLPKGRPLNMPPQTAEFLKREVPEIVRASPEFGRPASVRYGRKTLSQSVSGVYPEFAVMRNVIPESGRFINKIDQEYRKRSIFLGTNVRNDLFGEGADAIGKYVYVNGVPFMVVGVLSEKDQSSSYNSRDVDRAYIPSDTYVAMFGENYPDNFIYQIEDPLKWKSVQTKVFKALGTRFSFDPSDEEALWIWDTNESEEEFAPFFNGFRMFLGIVGLFTLVVGGIGTANIMYVVVKERTKEIGIKMALGATKFHIMSQILGEALILTGIGGTLGFLLAKGLVAVFPYMKLEEYIGTPTIAPWVALTSIGVLMLLGLLAGFFPARRAANLNPVECLRL